MEAVISGLDNWILAGALLVQMGLISWLLVERGRRRRASEALDERLRFETLLSDLSADFAGPDVADGKILAWLERLVTFLDVDRAALIPVLRSDNTAYSVLSYARPGVAPCPAAITEEEWPWYIQQIRRGATIKYTRIADELPPEAVLERAYVRSVGMKSHLSVPIDTGSPAICELMISTMRSYRTWSDDLVARIRVVGEIFAQASRATKSSVPCVRARQRYRSVVEHQSDLICRYLPDTTLTFVNDAYCRFWKKTRAELIGTKFLNLIPPDVREAARQHVDSIVAHPREENTEHQVLMPDGSIGWQQWIDRAIVGADGRVVELQAIGRDVTARRRGSRRFARAKNGFARSSTKPAPG